MASNWREVSVREALESMDSRRRPVKSADRRPGPYPYWGASGVVDHVDDFLFDEPTLLVSEDGENLRTRKTPISFYVTGKNWVNNHAHVFRARDGHNLRFHAYQFQTLDVAGYLTGSTQPKLTSAAVQSIRLAAPPVDEQRRIAEVLGALDNLIDTNTRSIGAIESLLQSQFEALSFDSAGGTKLIDRVELNPHYIKPKRIAPYIDMTALPTNSFFIDDVSSRPAAGGARFKRNDVLLARITPCLENGKAAFAGNLLEDEVYVGSTEFIVMRSRAGVPAAWPYFLARSERFREFAIRHMTGSSGRQRLAAAALEDYEVGGDSAALLEFDRLAAKLLEAASELSEESKTLGRTRDELLPLLMSGKVRVRPEEVAA
jgi:type I restriction enzyme, S subunit